MRKYEELTKKQRKIYRKCIHLNAMCLMHDDSVLGANNNESIAYKIAERTIQGYTIRGMKNHYRTRQRRNIIYIQTPNSPGNLFSSFYERMVHEVKEAMAIPTMYILPDEEQAKTFAQKQISNISKNGENHG